MEKRNRRRVPLKVTGKIGSSEQDPVNGCTRNISSVGAFFDADNTIPVGTDVELEILLPLEKLNKTEQHEAKMKVSGTVVRVEEGGVAVLFRGLKVLVSGKDE